MSASESKSPMPNALGYFMPAEWSRHRATWLSWPHNRETWPTQLEEVRKVWIEMIGALATCEHVYVLVNDDAAEREVGARLAKTRASTENVTLLKIPTVDVWMRDYGPTFVVRRAAKDPLAFNDWIFNGWGGKYPAYEDDDRVAPKIATFLNVPVFAHDVVLEGGSIEVNGAGTCMTTEQCLLNRNRNPQLSRAAIENFLKAALGATHVVWLGEGIAGDDTDGHIDDIARFVNPTTVVCAVEANSKDENYRALEENYERLQDALDQNGRKFSIVKLPCPTPVSHGGGRVPASYANFYIANNIVLVPVFDDANDARALGILQELFPDRKVVGIRGTETVAGLGAIHCVTQQEPATE